MGLLGRDTDLFLAVLEIKSKFTASVILVWAESLPLGSEKVFLCSHLLQAEKEANVFGRMLAPPMSSALGTDPCLIGLTE